MIGIFIIIKAQNIRKNTTSPDSDKQFEGGENCVS